MAVRRKGTVANAPDIKNWLTDVPGELSGDKLTFSLPTVVGRTARGGRSEWTVVVQVVREESGPALPILLAYRENGKMPAGLMAKVFVLSRIGEGKIRKAVPTFVREGKYIGRANETNVYCQGLRVALKQYNMKLRKVVDGNASGARPLPMLASIAGGFEFQWPVYVQRKYNGIRAIACIDEREGDVILYGRKGLLFPGFTDIKAELREPLEDFAISDGEGARALFIDGELYRHGMSLQEISGVARRVISAVEKGEEIGYVVYDAFICDAGGRPGEERFAERLKLIESLRANWAHFKQVSFADTFTATSAAEVKAHYERFLAEGYEGAIVRLNEPYVLSPNDYHSKVLLKIKPVHDAEYEIIGFTAGEKGKAAGALLYRCRTAGGAEFVVTPALPLAERMELVRKFSEKEANGRTYFENRLLGRRLIVMYDELSAAGVPQRARTAGHLREFD